MHVQPIVDNGDMHSLTVNALPPQAGHIQLKSWLSRVDEMPLSRQERILIAQVGLHVAELGSVLVCSIHVAARVIGSFGSLPDRQMLDRAKRWTFGIR